MATPEFLGPYRIGETLGRGGMGTVFRGVHHQSGQPVAVKLIAAHLADEMKFRRRFDAEIETLKRLRHRNIVELIGYGEEDGQLFYSMELVEGEPLQKRIRREKRLAWMPTIDIAIQICAALKHAHDIGVIHRDLKPANLILTKNDQVKLVDFGIAKIFGSGEQTMTGSILGTADYMSPEQATGDGITLRSDLYALGSVMYAMSAGRAPFKGKKITQVIDALKRDDPIPLEIIVPETPDELVALIHQLLEKNPVDRPPTALAVMNRLKTMRNDLIRERTLDEESENTQRINRKDFTGIAHEISMVNSDTSAHADHNTPVSGIESDSVPDGKANAASKSKTASAARDVQHMAGTIKQRGAAHADPTLIAGKSADDGAKGGEASKKPTHFQTIGQSLGQDAIAGRQSESSSALTQVLSIVAIIGLLVLSGVSIGYALRKPSAQEIYDDIIATTSVGTLADARPQIEQFLKLYPNDDHFDDVVAMDLSLQRDAVIRRLQLQSKLPSRTLDPHEQAYLEAMELRKVDTQAAQKKLQQWLDVFVDSTTHASDERRQIATLVQFERDRLEQQSPRFDDDPRNRELISRIKTAEALPAKERTALLQGIIDLYGDNEWATPAVEMAQQQLQQ